MPTAARTASHFSGSTKVLGAESHRRQPAAVHIGKAGPRERASGRPVSRLFSSSPEKLSVLYVNGGEGARRFIRPLEDIQVDTLLVCADR